MSGITIDIRDTVTPLLADLRTKLSPAQLARPVGQGVANLFRAHFQALNAARANDLGGTRTNFYAGAARGTSWQPTGDGVMISVAKQGIAQRFFGGTIHAKPGSALTIPATAEAYGKRAREFTT